MYIGEPSAELTRRADDGLSGIFRGGPTPPASSSAEEICDEFPGRDAWSGAMVSVSSHGFRF